MSNIIRMPCPPAGAPCPPGMPPAPPGPPFPGTQWQWDGCQWVCAPVPSPMWPPPGCAPPVCPPAPVPPSCFSAIAKAQACYDQSKALTDLITEIIEDIFANNPGIIPPPPPSAGTGPIIGVTDGSDAAPGQVGEIIRSTVTGSLIASPAGGTSAFAAITLNPGDWDMQSTLTLIDASTASVFVDIVSMVLATPDGPDAIQFSGNWAPSTSFGLGGGNTFTTRVARVSTAAPTLITGTIGVSTNTNTTPCNWSVFTRARRMR